MLGATNLSFNLANRQTLNESGGKVASRILINAKEAENGFHFYAIAHFQTNLNQIGGLAAVLEFIFKLRRMKKS